MGKTLLKNKRINQNTVNPEFQTAVQYIETAIKPGLNYEEKAQAGHFELG